MMVGHVCLLILLVLTTLSAPTHAQLPPLFGLGSIPAPCGEPGYGCCEGKWCAAVTPSPPRAVGNICVGQTANTPGVCTPCGQTGEKYCPDPNGSDVKICYGNSVSSRLYVRSNGRCVECPNTSFWGHTPLWNTDDKKGACVPLCGAPDLPACPECAPDIKKPYVDANGQCRSCNARKNNYFKAPTPAYGYCDPCGTLTTVPCRSSGCPGLSNPFVDRLTGFCASCNTATSIYTAGNTVHDATCLVCSNVASTSGSGPGISFISFAARRPGSYAAVGQVLRFGQSYITSFLVYMNGPSTLRFTGIIAPWDGTRPGEPVYTSSVRTMKAGENSVTFNDLNLKTQNGEYIFYVQAVGGAGIGQVGFVGFNPMRGIAGGFYLRPTGSDAWNNPAGRKLLDMGLPLPPDPPNPPFPPSTLMFQYKMCNP